MILPSSSMSALPFSTLRNGKVRACPLLPLVIIQKTPSPSGNQSQQDSSTEGKLLSSPITAKAVSQPLEVGLGLSSDPSPQAVKNVATMTRIRTRIFFNCASSAFWVRVAPNRSLVMKSLRSGLPFSVLETGYRVATCAHPQCCASGLRA